MEILIKILNDQTAEFSPEKAGQARRKLRNSAPDPPSDPAADDGRAKSIES